MKIYIFMFILLVFLELVCSFMLIFNVKKSENLSLGLLILNMLVVILSYITKVSFFYNIIYSSIKFNIFYLVINFILILGYFGIDDNLKPIHRIFVSLFYLLNTFGLIIFILN
ncbi:hypothetical protein [Oceanivirga miroungae]|uniref:Uncharacterized protein n=1 Tax=Oceanivirga miroungae TaxID=1130046 RepID=A0A6I8MBV5_9FUSO|nr:hypothetical protein [Oceanivirga miroungae]VWL85718.1 hypothetical protein OMES3154_01006 [Oceanivirga miroungae]